MNDRPTDAQFSLDLFWAFLNEYEPKFEDDKVVFDIMGHTLSMDVELYEDLQDAAELVELHFTKVMAALNELEAELGITDTQIN